MSNHFKVLSDNLYEHIFKHLDLPDLLSACLCCSKWREFANSDNLWRKFCKDKGWSKYGYGALDLMYMPTSEKVLTRTNVSGTSPRFELFETVPSLSPITKWRMIYIRANYLRTNWIKGRYNVLPNLRAHDGRVTSFDSNGMVLVSGSPDCLVIWDLETVSLRYKILSHGDQINSINLMGHIVAVGSAGGTVKVYDVITGNQLTAFHARSSADQVRFINKELIICAYADKGLRVWSLREKKLKYTLRGHVEEIECMAVCGNVCITGDWCGNVIFWDISQGCIMHHIKEDSEIKHNDSVMGCAIDEDIALTGDGEGFVFVWKVLSGECIHQLQAGTKDVYCLELSKDYIAAGGSAGLISIWNRADYSHLFNLTKHLGVVRSVKFNGEFLITGGDRKMICVWSLKTGALLNVVHRNPDLLHIMWVNESKIITASPGSPGSLSVLSYW